MLTAQQQLFVQALEELNLDQVKQLLADGLNPNFIDHDKGPVISVWSDGLFKWWEEVCELYEAVHHFQKRRNRHVWRYICRFWKN